MCVNMYCSCINIVNRYVDIYIYMHTYIDMNIYIYAYAIYIYLQTYAHMTCIYFFKEHRKEVYSCQRLVPPTPDSAGPQSAIGDNYKEAFNLKLKA